MGSRRCSRTGCSAAAITTLTYVYDESTAVLGPLALRAEPHSYDLCRPHGQTLSAPRGWEVIRLEVDEEPGPSSDDLVALADAVREIGFSYDQPVAGPAPRSEPAGRPTIVELGRRAHLTVLADPDA